MVHFCISKMGAWKNSAVHPDLCSSLSSFKNKRDFSLKLGFTPGIGELDWSSCYSLSLPHVPQFSMMNYKRFDWERRWRMSQVEGLNEDIAFLYTRKINISHDWIAFIWSYRLPYAPPRVLNSFFIPTSSGHLFFFFSVCNSCHFFSCFSFYYWQTLMPQTWRINYTLWKLFILEKFKKALIMKKNSLYNHDQAQWGITFSINRMYF